MASRSRAGSLGRTALVLIGAGALAAVGFGAGIVAGVLAEEPELLAGHLAGRSTDVPWAGEPVTVTDADTDGVAGAEVAGAPEPATRGRALPDVAAGQGSGWVVQVGAFAESEPAEALVATLQGKGFPAFLTPGAGSPGSRWRVRVGPLGSREDADGMAERLKTQERLPTWVLGEDGP